MTRLERFSEQEIPYEQLATFGLSQEMIDDLPRSVMTRLLSSHETPLLPVKTKNVDGEEVEGYAKVLLVRTTDGQVNAAFITRWESDELSNYTPDQQQVLKDGKVSTVELPGKGLCFIQFDDTIKQVIATPTSFVRQNLDILVKDISLSSEDYDRIMDGEVVQVETVDDTFSIGVDLNDDMGIRLAHGSKQEWREEAKAEKLPKYNFGIYGCWMTDDFGNLSYVSEDDYTAEMEAEQQRAGQQHVASAQLGRMGGMHR